MYLYDGRVKVPNYGKLPNGAQLGQCLLVPPYGNYYMVPSCAVPLTSIIFFSRENRYSHDDESAR